MFLRIDTDLFVNVNNIFSYKIIEDIDSYKVVFWGSSGSIVNTVIYLKQNQQQMGILIDMVNSLKDFTINPDKVIPKIEEPKIEEPKRRVRERIETPEGQMTLDDFIDEK